jgi:hypothetical protein
MVARHEKLDADLFHFLIQMQLALSALFVGQFIDVFTENFAARVCFRIDRVPETMRSSCCPSNTSPSSILDR